MFKKTLGTLAVAACAALAVLPAVAQSTWPDKPVKLVLPYPPGDVVEVEVSGVGVLRNVVTAEEVAA